MCNRDEVSNKFDPTFFHMIGVEFLNKDLEVDGERYTLQIWDTAGQERFKSLQLLSIEAATAVC